MALNQRDEQRQLHAVQEIAKQFGVLNERLRVMNNNLIKLLEQVVPEEEPDADVPPSPGLPG